MMIKYFEVRIAHQKIFSIIPLLYLTIYIIIIFIEGKVRDFGFRYYGFDILGFNISVFDILGFNILG